MRPPPREEGRIITVIIIIIIIAALVLQEPQSASARIGVDKQLGRSCTMNSGGGIEVHDWWRF